MTSVQKGIQQRYAAHKKLYVAVQFLHRYGTPTYGSKAALNTSKLTLCLIRSFLLPFHSMLSYVTVFHMYYMRG